MSLPEWSEFLAISKISLSIMRILFCMRFKWSENGKKIKFFQRKYLGHSLGSKKGENYLQVWPPRHPSGTISFKTWFPLKQLEERDPLIQNLLPQVYFQNLPFITPTPNPPANAPPFANITFGTKNFFGTQIDVEPKIVFGKTNLGYNPPSSPPISPTLQKPLPTLLHKHIGTQIFTSDPQKFSKICWQSVVFATTFFRKSKFSYELKDFRH